MALTVVGGSSFLGRYLIKSLSSQYPEIRLADMYPYRDSIYRLQEELGGKLKKYSLAYPTGLKYAIHGSSRLIIIDHDYFKLAHGKNFYLEKSVRFAKDFDVTDVTWVHPIELTHLSNLEGNPDLLVNKAEETARSLLPELKTIRTSLIFGSNCLSLLLRKALEDLSRGKPIVRANSGETTFAPVFEEDFLSAFRELESGKNVVIEGPEQLSYDEIISTLAQSLGVPGPKHNKPMDFLRKTFSVGNIWGEILYPSHLQQLYRLLIRPEKLTATVQGKTKLSDHFKANSTPKLVENLNWHRVILD